MTMNAERQNQLQKEMEIFWMENQQLMEEFRGPKNLEKCPKKVEKPIYLSRLSKECILGYIEPYKRILMKDVGKSIPLKMRYLEFSPPFIRIDNVQYTFKNGQGTDSDEEEEKEEEDVGGSVLPEYVFYVTEPIRDAYLKAVFEMFAGRKITVENLECKLDVPFELNIHVKFLKIGRTYNGVNHFGHYCNVVRSVDEIIFTEHCEPVQLRYSWVQHAKRLFTVCFNNSSMLKELPNIRAETIYIHIFYNTISCLDLINAWCQNKKIGLGAKLFLTLRRAIEHDLLDTVFNSTRLQGIGFIYVDNKTYRLPMENNLEIILSWQSGQDLFDYRYCRNALFATYLRLEVVNSQGH